MILTETELLKVENIRLKKASVTRDMQLLNQIEGALSSQISERLGVDLSKYSIDPNTGALSLIAPEGESDGLVT